MVDAFPKSVPNLDNLISYLYGEALYNLTKLAR